LFEVVMQIADAYLAP